MEDINKDIKELEESIKEAYRCYDYDLDYNPLSKGIAEIIEHLIKAYKELEENINKQKQLTKIAQTITDESIKEALIEFEKDYIPVSLVEETIKKLKENGYWNYLEERDLETTIDILQELLEKRK